MKALNNIVSFILSTVFWLFGAVMSVFWSLTGFLLWPLTLLMDRRNRSGQHAIVRLWGKTLVMGCPFWSIRVQGLEKIDRRKTYVIVANHQSMVDILAAVDALPLNFKFMAKKELFSIPFIGWQMRLAGYIALDRASRESGRKAIVKAIEWVERGASVLLFPEGTRSEDGRVKAFKPGAFKIAKETGVEILPVVIDGTGHALPKHSLKLDTRSDFQVTVLDPVSTAGLEPDELSEKVRLTMMEKLTSLRNGAK